MRLIAETAMSPHGVDARNKSRHDRDSDDQRPALWQMGALATRVAGDTRPEALRSELDCFARNDG
jgi:hypothetical protein